MKQSSYLFICLFTALLALRCETKAQSEISIGEVHSFFSNALQEDREYRLFLPASYHTSDALYPVVYVLDGSYYYLSALSAVEALSGQGAMPDCIVVAVSSPDRRSDMSPPSMRIPGIRNANGDRFLEFMADELVPLIRENYRTRPLNVLVGHSHGAIFNLYALSRRPDVFNWNLALDAPVHLDNNYLQTITESFLEQHPGGKARLAVGWNRYGWEPGGWARLQALRDQGFSVWEVDLPGETHSSMYHVGFYKGLKQLFSDYAYKHDQILKFSELEARYNTMNEEYGYEISIPVWALRYGAIEYLAAAEPVEAELFLKRLKSDYNSSQLLDDDGDDWLATLKTTPPDITRAKYLAKKNAELSDLKPFLGAWSDGIFTIKISGNIEKSEAIVEQVMPDGTVLKMPISKMIRLSDGSLELSHENGMPPRSGLIIYKFSSPEGGEVDVEKRFMVYWPKMNDRNRPTRMVLRKVKDE